MGAERYDQTRPRSTAPRTRSCGSIRATLYASPCLTLLLLVVVGCTLLACAGCVRSLVCPLVVHVGRRARNGVFSQSRVRSPTSADRPLATCQPTELGAREERGRGTVERRRAPRSNSTLVGNILVPSRAQERSSLERHQVVNSSDFWQSRSVGHGRHSSPSLRPCSSDKHS